MKILHAILSEGFYGSERYCAELAAAQTEAGHDVRMVIAAPNVDYSASLREALGVGGASRLITLPRWSVLHRPFARRILRAFGPALVHTHLNPAARRVGRVARRLDIPHVATLHLGYNDAEYGQCDGLICIAAWQRASVPPTHRGEITLIRNWLPDRIATAIGRTKAPEVESLRRRWGARETTFVFGSVGRLMPEKGMDILVQAFRRAFPGGAEDVRLVLVGDGEQRHELARLAAGDPRIVLAGWQNDVAAFYLGFDTFVSAARFEPFGLAILEAMVAGCPLVLSRTQGPQEFVDDRRVVWTEPAAAALAESLCAAMRSGRRRQRYDVQAFSSGAAFAAIETFYRQIIERAQIRSPNTVTRTP
jgi:glycosyltransferase involved in cell wall biosynthesis